jgi:hypothetical protein
MKRWDVVTVVVVGLAVAMGTRSRYAPTDRGGQITIDTSNREARRAIHDFLRFQIRDHRTED